MTYTQQEILERWLKSPVFMCDKNIGTKGDEKPCMCQECDTNRHAATDWWLAEVEKAEGKGIREGFLAGQKAMVEQCKTIVNRYFENSDPDGENIRIQLEFLLSLQTLEDNLNK